MSIPLRAWLAGAVFAATILGCNGGGGGGEGDTPRELVVESTEPAADAAGVYLDQEIRVVFSLPLDPAMPEAAFTVVAADGVPAQGRVSADNRTAIFTPARFAAEQTYEVTLGTEITSGDLNLEEPYTFQFATGLTTSDQTEPPGPESDPLGPGEVVGLGTQAEVAILWSGGVDARFAVEDPPFNPSPLRNPGSSTNEARQIADLELTSETAERLPVVGQFDGDGWEETLIVANDPSAGPQVIVVDTVDNRTLEEVTTTLPFENADTFDAAAGDLDDDGRDELVLALTARKQIWYYVVDYDLENEEYEIAASGSRELGEVGAQYVKVTAGDVDADRKDEVVLAWHVVEEADLGRELSDAYYVVLDDLDHDLTQVRPQRAIKKGMPWQDYCHHSYVEVEAADVDGDGADEILFGVTEPTWLRNKYFFLSHWEDNCAIYDSLVVADNVTTDESREFELTTFWSAEADGEPAPIGEFWYWSAWVANEPVRFKLQPVLVPADLDGDQRPEVMFHNRLFKFAVNERVDDGSMRLEPEWPVVIDESIIDFGPGPGGRPADLADEGITYDVKAAYVDGGVEDPDLKEDIVLLRRDAESIWVDLFDITVKPQKDDTIVVKYDDQRVHLQEAGDYMTYEGRPRLALPHVDRDSITVEKVGHDVYLGDNVVIAVLAAPPCSDALGQELGSCATQFGQGTTQAWSDGAYVNASAGIVVGLKAKPKIPLVFISLKLAEFELEVTGGVEGSYQYSSGREVTEQVSHTAGADNNLVVFEAYVYDRYQYRYVVHPDPDEIGQPVTVSVPTGHKLLAAGLDYYNANNGDQVDIEPDVIAVIPGDLSSYPTRGEAEELAGRHLQLAMSSQAVRTPRGKSNSVGLEHGVSTTHSQEVSVGLFVEVTAKTCGPDVSGTPTLCGGIEESRSAGWAHVYEWSKDLIFAGTVAGLPEDEWAESAYDVGLFAYAVELNDPAVDESQNFMVVSYFIE